MEIRKTTFEDLDKINEIYAIARRFMKDTGNPNQWRDDKPLVSDILNDIEKGNSYVVLENGEIAGVFAFILGEDPTYGYIEDGNWLIDEPYGTIHRIASSGKYRGVFDAAVDFGLTIMDNIRIDTHHDNKVMQHLLGRKGFSRCGIIYLLNGEQRIAYQLCNDK